MRCAAAGVVTASRARSANARCCARTVTRNITRGTTAHEDVDSRALQRRLEEVVREKCRTQDGVAKETSRRDPEVVSRTKDGAALRKMRRDRARVLAVSPSRSQGQGYRSHNS